MNWCFIILFFVTKLPNNESLWNPPLQAKLYIWPENIIARHKNLVYLVFCYKFNDQYIGKTKKLKKTDMIFGCVGHRDFRQATGRHFNLPGHQKSHMSITVLESINTDDQAYRKRRESEYIQQFNLKYKGMNRRRWHFANCKQNIFVLALGTETNLKNIFIICYDYCLMRILLKNRKY